MGEKVECVGDRRRHLGQWSTKGLRCVEEVAGFQLAHAIEGGGAACCLVDFASVVFWEDAVAL